MTNLPTFTDISKMFLISEQEYSALVAGGKTYKINADMAFEELAKKKEKTLTSFKFVEIETVTHKSSQNNPTTYKMLKNILVSNKERLEYVYLVAIG